MDLFLYRPVLADPPLCNVMDLHTQGRMTMAHLLDMHELLDLRGATAERAARDAERG